MAKYILRRILAGVLTVFFIITFAFFALRLIPGDPVEVWLGEWGTPELAQAIRAKWGLDKPIWAQYTTFLENILRGDLGDSLRMQSPVLTLLRRHLPFTLRLVFFGTSISTVIIAIPIGVFAASRQNSFLDLVVMIVSFVFISMPAFWLGLLVLLTFSVRLGWFPSIGAEVAGKYSTYWSYLLLPSLCVGLRSIGEIARMVRSTMIDTLSRNYIIVARSKGLSEPIIRYKHALRNALSPIVSFIGVSIVLSLTGAVVLEIVFTRPGLGRLYVEAVAARDYPLIQGCILVIAIWVVIVNTLVDIGYGMIDPRIRYE